MNANLLPVTRHSSLHTRFVLRAMARSDDDEDQEADQLHAKEREANGDDRIGLLVKDVDRGLADASDQDGHAQIVHGRAVRTNGGDHEHDGSKYRKVLHAICVSSCTAPVPIVSFETIAPERCDRSSIEKDLAPSIHADGRHQQEQGPRGESQ
jgi:hypothetical protein